MDDARVGDPDPLAAIQDECNFSEYDEVIVSTLPLHLSKWLQVDLPRKARAATGLPVEHVNRHVVVERHLMDLEERGSRPRDRAQLRASAAKLTEAEIKASLEAGGPFLCTVHADEEVRSPRT